MKIFYGNKTNEEMNDFEVIINFDKTMLKIMKNNEIYYEKIPALSQIFQDLNLALISPPLSSVSTQISFS